MNIMAERITFPGFTWPEEAPGENEARLDKQRTLPALVIDGSTVLMEEAMHRFTTAKEFNNAVKGMIIENKQSITVARILAFENFSIGFLGTTYDRDAAIHEVEIYSNIGKDLVE